MGTIRFPCMSMCRHLTWLAPTLGAANLAGLRPTAPTVLIVNFAPVLASRRELTQSIAPARAPRPGTVAWVKPMLGPILLFLVVYLLNLAPAFAPPTWMVFSYIGFHYDTPHVLPLALIGAAAATLGRITLANLSRVVIRKKFMSQGSRDNVDAIRERLSGRRRLTFGVFLFYAFTPFPSNYLFIAYGLTAMDLRLIAIPFFIGRVFSYTFWGFTFSAVARRIAGHFNGALSYFSVYFVVSQFALLVLVYLFTKIDWRALFDDHRLKWADRRPQTPGNS